MLPGPAGANGSRWSPAAGVTKIDLFIAQRDCHPWFNWGIVLADPGNQQLFRHYALEHIS